MVRHPFLVWSSAPIHEGNFTHPGENTYAICVKPAQKIRADQDLVESVPKIIQGFCLVVVIGARRVVVPVTKISPHRIIKEGVTFPLHHSIAPRGNFTRSYGV